MSDVFDLQNCPCDSECPPLTEAGPTGPAGVGVDGTDGTNGVNAYTALTASFVLPAVNASITASVGSSVWMAYGQILLIGTGSTFSFFQVTAKPTTTSATIKNLGGTGAATPGTTIPNSSNVVVAGREGSAGSGTIDLESDVDGVLPIVNGGTGEDSKGAAFTALSPLDTVGQLIGYNGTSSAAADPPSTDGKVLVADSGAEFGFIWTTLDLSDADTVGASILGVDNGGTGLASLTPGTILIASGASTFDELLLNLTATSDPTVADDTSEGYVVGSRWVNTSSGEEFVCVDDTDGAAVWMSTTNSASAGYTRTAVSSTPYAVQPDETFICVSLDTATINLPDAATYPSSYLTIKHEGSSAVVNIAVVADAGDTVEGVSSISIVARRGYVTLYKSSSSAWRILNKSTYSVVALEDGGTASNTLHLSPSYLLKINSSGSAFEAFTPMGVTLNSGADSIIPSTPAQDTFDGSGQSYYTFSGLDQTKWVALLSQIEALRDTMSSMEISFESFVANARTNKLIA